MAASDGKVEDNLSEECFDFICTTCNRKKINKEAISYCTDCNKNLCNTCVQIHEEHVEGHKIVDLKDVDEGCVLTEKCEKHKEEIIKLFCAGHNDVVCSVCAQLDHRKCNDVKDIAECVEELNGPDMDAVPDKVMSALQDVEQVINALDRHVEKLSEQEHKFLDEIEEYTKKILVMIEQMKANAEKEVIRQHEQQTSQAIKKKETCLIVKENLCKNLENMKASGRRKAHLFVLKKKGQLLTEKVKTSCQESEDLIDRSRLWFRCDTRIESCLKEFNSVAAVEEKYKPVSKDNVNISVSGESALISCKIQGCCVLPDGTILLVDGTNGRLKHVDPSTGTVKSHCELQGSLRGIAAIGPHGVAVGTRSSEIQIVSLCGTPIIKAKTMDHACRRLTGNRGELFAADNKTVYVYDTTWKLLSTIPKSKTGQKMFRKIYGIAVDSTVNRIFVADWHNGLVCVDRDGREKFRRSAKELGLSGPYGVCTGGVGNVFVCGYYSYNVVQVSADGRVLGEILSKAQGIEKPRCLCFDPKTSTLYVGGSTAKLLSFKLQYDE